jgi:hypothetical protein
MALFLQWQKLEFPVLMDPLNILGVKAVPITLLVDEHGMIRYRNPKQADLTTFLETSYQQDKEELPHELRPFEKEALAALHSNDKKKIKDAIAFLARNDFSEDNPERAFYAGVLFRCLFDHHKEPGAFQDAVDCWSSALRKLPTQYIWRRRIQQYGPRLDKPYPFYNWIETAQRELAERGETPIELTIEPTTSEVAQPLAKEENPSPREFTDLANKLPNEHKLLKITATLIPHTDRMNRKRLHLQLTPQKGSHWTSDAQEVELWLRPGQGQPLFLSQEASLLPDDQETSPETRTLEADCDLGLLEGGQLILFYSLCETDNGICRFLKTEWSFEN